MIYTSRKDLPLPVPSFSGTQCLHLHPGTVGHRGALGLSFILPEGLAFEKSLKSQCGRVCWGPQWERYMEAGALHPSILFCLQLGGSTACWEEPWHVLCDLEQAAHLSEPQSLSPQGVRQQLLHGVMVGVQGELHEAPRTMPGTLRAAPPMSPEHPGLVLTAQPHVLSLAGGGLAPRHAFYPPGCPPTPSAPSYCQYSQDPACVGCVRAVVGSVPQGRGWRG